jgi:PAS domain S-box-containing protein
MKVPAQPADEAQRLSTLYALNLLDTPPEARFDAITRAAASLFGTETALISLVDANRQWFKSRHNLSVAETPRDVSFCGHAILERDVLVVEDALRDERFHDNPLVTSAPHVRFYAGAPVEAPNGSRLGTLCLLDRAPRSFGAPQRKLLEDLASWVEAEVRLLAERRAMGIFLDRLLDVVNEPVIMADGEGDIVFANRACFALLRYSAQEIYGKPLAELIAPEQRARFSSELSALSRAGQAFTSLEYRATIRGGRGDDILRTLAFFRSEVAGRPITAVVLRP